MSDETIAPVRRGTIPGGILGLLEALEKVNSAAVCKNCTHNYEEAGFNNYCFGCKGINRRNTTCMWKPIKETK